MPIWRSSRGDCSTAGIRFQISLPTPIAPTYNNMVPTDRPALIPVLTTHMLGEVTAIAQALPNERIALQWDVCQEVIAWEGYYEPGPVDFRKETIAELIAIGDGVPATIELGYHLCYGSPADDHVIQPKDAGIMVEIVHLLRLSTRNAPSSQSTTGFTSWSDASAARNRCAASARRRPPGGHCQASDRTARSSCSFSASKLVARGTGTSRLRRIRPTSPSTLPLSGRPDRSANT